MFGIVCVQLLANILYLNNVVPDIINRSGKYEISEAEGVERGTKIVIHLKGDSYDFAKEENIKGCAAVLLK